MPHWNDITAEPTTSKPWYSTPITRSADPSGPITLACARVFPHGNGLLVIDS